MIASIAWKNIWRNKVRSLVIIAAIAFGITGVIFTIGISEGMVESRNRKIIETQISDIQIHNPKFLDSHKWTDTISRVQDIEKILKSEELITGYSKRLVVLGMLSSSYSSQPAQIVAIDPQQESKVTNVKKYLIAGKYLDDVKSENVIVIGKELARKLQMVSYEFTDSVIEVLREQLPENVFEKVKKLEDKYFHTPYRFYATLDTLLDINEFTKYSRTIADAAMKFKLRRKIVVRVQGADGNVVDEAFRIVGIYFTNNTLFDGMYVFVKKNHFAKVLNVSDNTTNEIAIKTKDFRKIEDLATQLQEKLPWVKVRSAFEIDPFLKLAKTVMKLYYLIFEVFVLFALSFGIINTMLMAVMERTKEIGMLMAIGMNRKRIFNMIMFESVLLTLTGGVIGMLLGELIVIYFGKTGLNIYGFAEQGLAALGIDTLIYPKVPFYLIIGSTILIIITGVLAAIYPAAKALKLNPADALRTEV